MDTEHDILTLLEAVASGILPPDQALGQLRFSPVTTTLDGIAVDHHRALRTGQRETVFGEGKSIPHLLSAVTALQKDNATPVLATRVSKEQAQALVKAFPQGEYTEAAGLFSLNKPLKLTPPWPADGEVVVVTAGAADMRVGLEALGTCRFCGVSAAFASDIGVAGLHRIRPWLPVFAKAKAIIVVAGMEGALPSVIAGFTRCPVLAVPVSVGYGVSKGGYAALITMLSSCAPGISVFNIDNGYGAAMFAARITAL